MVLLSRLFYVFFSFIVLLFYAINLLSDDHASYRDHSSHKKDMEEISLRLLAVDGLVRALNQAKELKDGEHSISTVNFSFEVFMLFLHDFYHYESASFVINRYRDIYNLEFSSEEEEQIRQLQYFLRYSRLNFFTIGGNRVLSSLHRHISLNKHRDSYLDRIEVDR